MTTLKGELDDVVVGQSLCVVGIGSDNMIHRHVTITSITKLFINSTYTLRGGPMKARHRKDNARSVPYSPYGGTAAYTECRRPDHGLRPL